jgi:hypothetical protein
MNTEYDDTVEMEASERRPKKKKLTLGQILASMSEDEAQAFCENIPVHAAEEVPEVALENMHAHEMDTALSAARDVRFRNEALGYMAARFNWKI